MFGWLFKEKVLQEKILNKNVEKAIWRSFASSEIDLMPPEMAKEYAEVLAEKEEKDPL